MPERCSLPENLRGCLEFVSSEPFCLLLSHLTGLDLCDNVIRPVSDSVDDDEEEEEEEEEEEGEEEGEDEGERGGRGRGRGGGRGGGRMGGREDEEGGGGAEDGQVKLNEKPESEAGLACYATESNTYFPLNMHSFSL